MVYMWWIVEWTVVGIGRLLVVHFYNRNTYGGWKCCGRSDMLYNNYRNSFWKAVFQNRKIVSDAIWGGGGVDGAIHRAAGPELLTECRTLHGCETGGAKITKAYNLPCDYVIHTVGPIWNGGRNREEELLSNCYFNSMKLARDNGIRSIAFPSISTGAYSFPVVLAAKIAVRTVARFLHENPDSFDLVEWVLFDTQTESVYEAEVTLYYNIRI